MRQMRQQSPVRHGKTCFCFPCPCLMRISPVSAASFPAAPWTQTQRWGKSAYDYAMKPYHRDRMDIIKILAHHLNGQPMEAPSNLGWVDLVFVHISNILTSCEKNINLEGELSQDNKPWLCVFKLCIYNIYIYKYLVKLPESSNPRQVVAYLSTASWVWGILRRAGAGPNTVLRGQKWVSCIWMRDYWV